MTRATSHVDGFTRVRLFGLDFVDDTSIEPLADFLLDHRASEIDGTPVVLTPNTDLLLQVEHSDDERLRGFFADAWCVIPDGQPVVWASRLLGSPVRGRLTGSDLFAHLWPRLVDRRTPVFVLASSEAVASGLERSHPGASTLVAPQLRVDGHGDVAALAADCAGRITAAGATIAVLCLGHPKDAMLADEILRRLADAGADAPFVLCLGGSAEMYLGIRKRAPRWVQRCSAEWLYRFAQEPRRLFHRYFVRDVAFVPLVWREYRAQRRSDPLRPAS